MNLESIGPYKRFHLHPGEFFVSSRPIVISTLLGSCVAACLYDPIKKVMGMNHFLLSGDTSPANAPLYLSEAGRYGIHAMELLINEMMRQGAKRDHLHAKVFGGSSIMGISPRPGYRVGENNIRFILEFLALENIVLQARDLGGKQGRVIHFCYGDFSVYVRKIHPGRTAHLAKRDRMCWINSLQKYYRTQSPVDLWD